MSSVVKSLLTKT